MVRPYNGCNHNAPHRASSNESLFLFIFLFGSLFSGRLDFYHFQTILSFESQYLMKWLREENSKCVCVCVCGLCFINLNPGNVGYFIFPYSENHNHIDVRLRCMSNMNNRRHWAKTETNASIIEDTLNGVEVKPVLSDNYAEMIIIWLDIYTIWLLSYFSLLFLLV